MKQEIERKFLVKDDSWRTEAGAGQACVQGYLSSDPGGATVRVRLLGGRGFLTIKGPTTGISRSELEYEIPSADAAYMLKNLCGTRVVEKTRYFVHVDGMRWEVDEFCGANEGLTLAEIELADEKQVFSLPDWAGDDVSSDGRYTNAALSIRPRKDWP